jgi:hypothetical protein
MLKQQFLLCITPLVYSVVQFSVLTVPRTPFSNHEPSQAPNAKRSSHQHLTPRVQGPVEVAKHIFCISPMSRRIMLSLFLDHILIHTQLSPPTTTPPALHLYKPTRSLSLSFRIAYIHKWNMWEGAFWTHDWSRERSGVRGEGSTAGKQE